MILTAPLVVAAQTPPALNESGSLLGTTANAAGLTNDALPPEQIIANLIEVALGAVGVVFIVLILYGGYLWGTGRGNEDRVYKAQRLITESIIGVIIVFGAYFITAFVINSVGNASFEPLFGL